MALERWETKITSANCDVTPRAIWPILESSKETNERKVAYFRPIHLTQSMTADISHARCGYDLTG
jgi:hypothetical protein